MVDDLKYFVSLNSVKGVSSKKILELETLFGSVKAVWGAKTTDLSNAKLSKEAVKNLDELRLNSKPEDVLDGVAKVGAKVVCIRSKEYPSILREIQDPPAVLYYRGVLPDDKENHLAVVGTRHATSYGNEACRRICSTLAAYGVSIVSGLAAGIDTQAHKVTLDSRGRTIAVLASGIDIVYPASNKSLARTIVENGGCVLTEYPLKTRPMRSYFPSRNRIVSGLSAGVLVVEAGEKSGALITARLALEQGKNVLAVPGNVTSTLSAGANRLIRDGARLVSAPEDVLDELNWKVAEGLSDEDDQKLGNLRFLENSTEKDIVDTLISSGNPMYIDDIIKATKKDTKVVASALGVLVISGVLNELSGKMYSVRKGL